MTEKWEEAAFSFINSLSDSSPTPGGGAAGAVSAAMGCALGEMMCSISSKSEFVSAENRIKLQKILPCISKLKKQLMANISEDAHAFEEYMKASKSIMPKEERAKAVQAALKNAAEVPLKTAMLSSEAIDILHKIKGSLSPKIMSDYFAAERLLKAAIECSAEIIKLNLKYLKDKNAAETIKQNLDKCLTKN